VSCLPRWTGQGEEKVACARGQETHADSMLILDSPLPVPALCHQTLGRAAWHACVQNAQPCMPLRLVRSIAHVFAYERRCCGLLRGGKQQGYFVWVLRPSSARAHTHVLARAFTPMYAPSHTQMQTHTQTWRHTCAII